MAQTWRLVVIAVGAVGALLYGPVMRTATVLGTFRRGDIPLMHGHELKLIPNTMQCEDLHHHRPSNLLFTACETGDPYHKTKWFPAAISPEHQFDLSGVSRGTIVVIDPKTLESTHLTLEGFSGPFVTHGIDIFSTPADPTLVTIFAVNHLPHPDAASPTQKDKARSQVEIFRHKIGTSTAQHVRSVLHPLIRTPNDLYAASPTSFYVTNDHYYRQGLLRTFEDFGNKLARWTDTVHVSFSETDAADATSGVTATQALTGVHNNNGLGHGSDANPSLVAIGDAAGGEITLASRNLSPRPGHPEDVQLTPFGTIVFDSSIDNPTYYDDPYSIPSVNASGFVAAGLYRPLDLFTSAKDAAPLISVVVWHATPQSDGSWQKKMIFVDDGKVINSAATAVLVGIDPVDNEGKKQGWLFVTGFYSMSVVASRVDL